MDTHVSIAGNLTADPELRYTPAGTAVTNFSVAVNTRKKNAEGVWEDGDPQFFEVTCWRGLAENVAVSLVKGDRVFLSGRVEQRTWHTNDGDTRSKVQFVADEVGPSLRWATCEVTRTRREAEPNTPVASYDPSEEPF